MTKSPEELRAELIALMAEHDWYYEHSDDYSHWAHESGKRYRIKELVKKVPDGQELYDAALPRLTP